MERSQVARLAALVVIGSVLLFFWNSPFVWPLKILVVFFHELGHACAAWLTGGEVVEIGLSPNQGGATRTLGGWRFFILNAGYLGSIVAGATLLFVGRTPKRAQLGLWGLCAVLAVSTLWLVRPVLSFGFAFALLATLGLAAIARVARNEASQWVLRGLGIFSLLYAVWDIRDDVFSDRPGLVSDATMLAELTYIPGPVWGGIWLVVGLGTLFFLRKWLI
jgi:hypothetical protein